MNVGDETVDLTGMSFTSGVRFDFSTANVTQLEAGQLAVVVRDREAFSLRYDATNILIAGQFSGRLNNLGERIVLTGSLGQVLAEVAYKDDWYDITDGEGFSLVRRQNEVAVTSASDAEQWRPSHYRDGSPGSIDPGYNPGSVVISEALTHNDVPVGDWLELHNTTANDIDISGWYISARPSEPTQYQIPEGTVLKAGGYLVFTANEHPDSPEYGGSMGFAISKLGEKVLITSSGRATELGGYRIEVDFTYGFNATTFIRHTNSTGQVEYVLGLVRTRGLPNALPAVDRIRDHNNVYPEAVISEIMYHPAAGGDEYIELFNPHSQPVRLAKPFSPSWRFTSGVFYIFEDDVAIPTKTYALVVPIDPDEFRAKYNVPAETQIFGPYDGELLNSGERLTVSRAAEAAAFVPFSMTDQVFYNHPSGQWPQEANGLGASLNRVSYRAYGNDVENWRAGAIGGTPGRPNVDFVADARVVERMLFYNDSYFDGYDADVFSSHNEAIAPDRFALLAGQRATITNYSNYDKGLNGVIVDIQNMPGTPTVADFQFRVGNDNSPGGWQPAPDPSFFYVRPSGGVNGSDRIEFAWEKGVIRNMWLEVTVLPTANTGLAAADVHYWGNAVGDIGNSLFEATVNEIDATFLANNLNVDFDVITRFDINRDLSVNQIDIDIVNASFVDASGAMVMLDLRGDFNGDRFTDAKDLDALSQTIAAQSTAARFDLNGDGAVTLADQALMIDQLLLTRPGDANLDRDVDSGDLNTVGRNWRMEVESWSQGDFNGDRVVNAADLNLLALNWRHGVPAAAPAARMPRAPLQASSARLREIMLPLDSQLDSTQGEGGDSLSTGIPDENVDDSVDEDVVDPPDYSTPADPNRGLPIDENPANDDEWMFSELVDDVLARWATSKMRLIVPTSRRA
jgi:hypothetical protein